MTKRLSADIAIALDDTIDLMVLSLPEGYKTLSIGQYKTNDYLLYRATCVNRDTERVLCGYGASPSIAFADMMGEVAIELTWSGL